MPTYSRTHEDCERRIDALKAENKRLRGCLAGVRDTLRHFDPDPESAYGCSIAAIDAALAHQPSKEKS